MSKIILTTLNAKYIHSAFGLRCIMANMGELQKDTAIKEFTINSRPIDVVEALLACEPTIIGLGVYIWNVEQSTLVVEMLREVAPHIKIVLGGPEVSHEYDEQVIVQKADHVITGWGDVSFPRLCEQLLTESAAPEKIIAGIQAPVTELPAPYDFYSDEDIKNRVLYVEASRGCPFKCEFCLSSLDKAAWPFAIDAFLSELDKLYKRGARHFKFVDRTFNLKVKTSLKILDFFLQRMSEDLFLHFEVIPDNLPDALKESLKQFPKDCLQLEIGIQTFNPEVQSLINRRQKNEASCENLRWLREETKAHLHVDLIFGLPGDDLQSFGESFDRLVGLNPQEIQVGILKRLRGTQIARHTEAYAMRYNPNPPYNVLSTSKIDFPTLQRVSRFARYWDMIGNSGRFSESRSLLLGEAPFERFLALSDWIFENVQQTHQIALPRLFEILYRALTELFACGESEASAVIRADFERSGIKGEPRFLKKDHQQPEPTGNAKSASRNSRQMRHVNVS